MGQDSNAFDNKLRCTAYQVQGRFKRKAVSVFMMIAMGVMSIEAMAKPDLTTPVDMQLLYAKDSGYHFMSQDFIAPAPKVDAADNEQYAKSRHYRVWLGIPKVASNQNHHQVLYMLDGNAALDELDKAGLKRLSEQSAPVLVLIGYQVPYRFDVDARAYDYTPPRVANEPSEEMPAAFKEAERARLNGGAESFYQLIETKIKPWVYKQLPQQPTHEALWGHSYGGLFVLYTLLEHPEAYQHYDSADPSLWWDDKAMLTRWKTYQRANKVTDSVPSVRLTFSQSATQRAEDDSTVNDDKAEFGQQVCAYFGKRCHAQSYAQSHGELFTTSLQTLLDSY